MRQHRDASAASPSPPINKLHPTIFAIYSVIVGFAIREALTRVVPLFTAPPRVDQTLELWHGYLLITRLVAFLVTCIRFYLGAIWFFNEVHLDPERSTQYEYRSFGLDFLVGLIHLLVVFAWATAIDSSHWNHIGNSTHFLHIAVVILLYDLAWIAVCWRQATRAVIKLWTFVNTSTVIVMIAVFFALQAADVEALSREIVALMVMIVVGTLDIAELINQKQYIADWLRRLIGVTAPTALNRSS